MKKILLAIFITIPLLAGCGGSHEQGFSDGSKNKQEQEDNEKYNEYGQGWYNGCGKLVPSIKILV